MDKNARTYVSYVHITELKENDMKVPDIIFR